MRSSKLKVLYAGNLFPGSTAIQRGKALAALGFPVQWFDFRYSKNSRFLLYRIVRKFLGLELDFLGLNKRLRAFSNSEKFDLIWIDKGLLINKQTLSYLRNVTACKYLVHFSPDDMLNPGNQSGHYLQAVPEYDLHITTKSYNLRELQELGARQVKYVHNSFDPEIHKPVDLSDRDYQMLSSDVGFIGAFEPERAQYIQYVARKGQKVLVRGQGWQKFQEPNVAIKQGWFADLEYSKVINATKINLCFLRKANRDLQTTRSVEIPACGGFMLAERTSEHLELFEEGKEADFFDSPEELAEKISYYLKHPKQRRVIALAGRDRCLRDGYDNASRLQKIINGLTAEV